MHLLYIAFFVSGVFRSRYFFWRRIKMKRKFAITIAFLLVALLAATLVACDIDDGKTPNGIVLREDMTLGELIEMASDVKSATVKAYDESNQLIYEKYYSENACICYFYEDKDLYSSLDMHDTQGWILDGSLLYQFYKDGDDTKMAVVDYDGYDYGFFAISCAESILECITGGNSTIENNTIVFTSVFILGYTYIPTIVYSNLNSTEFALPKEFANCKEEAETRPMLEYETTPFENDDTKCKITKINCNDNYELLKSIDIVIPKTIDGKTITEIGENVFGWGSYSRTNVNVIIPDSVTNIGDDAFCWCLGLSNVTISNSVTNIGESAFENCSGLTSITIPNSVTNIGNYAFSGCRSLTSVTIGNGVTSIGKNVFSGCEGLTSVTIPESVTSIGDDAFSGCIAFTDITIPNSVTSIGNYAFYHCNGLVYIDIPNSVTSIGEHAFERCEGLSGVTIPESVTKIGDYAFCKCDQLASVTVPTGVTSIGAGAVSDCAKLTTVNWYATACTTTQSVFYDCLNLTELNIGDNVTTIPAYAFRGCDGLTSLTIPNSVTSIGNDAFVGCRRLIEVYNKSSLDMEENSLRNYGLDYILNVYTEEGGSKLSVDKDGYVIYTDEGTKSLVAYHGTDTDIVLPSGITTINQYAFIYNDGIASIVIPDSVTNIGDDAFCWCLGLSNVTIGNGVTSIGKNVFSGCEGLTSVTIPESVTSIGDDAFERCFELETIYFNGTVEEFNKISIGASAFGSTKAKTVICTNGTVDKYFNDSIGD